MDSQVKDDLSLRMHSQAVSQQVYGLMNEKVEYFWNIDPLPTATYSKNKCESKLFIHRFSPYTYLYVFTDHGCMVSQFLF